MGNGDKWGLITPCSKETCILNLALLSAWYLISPLIPIKINGTWLIPINTHCPLIQQVLFYLMLGKVYTLIKGWHFMMWKHTSQNQKETCLIPLPFQFRDHEEELAMLTRSILVPSQFHCPHGSDKLAAAIGMWSSRNTMVSLQEHNQSMRASSIVLSQYTGSC